MEEKIMESLFSPEEINELNKKTSQEDLERFFYEIFIKNGDEEKSAREMAQRWSKEMTSTENL